MKTLKTKEPYLDVIAMGEVITTDVGEKIRRVPFGTVGAHKRWYGGDVWLSFVYVTD